METKLIYFILITSFLLPMIQVLVSMNYFKRFAFEYLSNELVSWNPNHDRSALVFSVFFGLGSIYLTRQIWQGNTDDSWFLTVIYLIISAVFSFFTIVFIRHIMKVNKESLNEPFNSIELITKPEMIETEAEISMTKLIKLRKIYHEFRLNSFIDDNLLENEFLHSQPILNLTNCDFYFFHKLYNQKIEKVTLLKFCGMFKNKNGDFFNYKSVRKDGTIQTAKNLDLFENIFSNI